MTTETGDEIPQVRRIRVGGHEGLGGADAVEVELEARRTVLFGKNGAGKSLLMGAATDAARLALISATARWAEHIGPREFSCDIGTRAHKHFSYEYRLEPPEADAAEQAQSPEAVDAAPQVPQRPGWFERCVLANGRELWRVERGQFTLRGDAAPLPIPRGVGVLSLGPDAVASPPEEIQQLRKILRSFVMVPAGVLRRGHGRDFSIVAARNRDGKKQILNAPQVVDRIHRLSASLLRCSEGNTERFEEFRELLERLGLARKLTVRWFEGFDRHADKERGPDAYGSIYVDDVNVGFLSDGTLRACEVLFSLISWPNGVLWIEEPETAIHPGLLERLLGVIETYSHDRQVVMSTHSPYVVNRCAPGDLRLVERRRNSTIVRALAPEEMVRVEAYLRDEGSLDEFVFAPDGLEPDDHEEEGR
jgi:hypothetical protein